MGITPGMRLGPFEVLGPIPRAVSRPQKRAHNGFPGRLFVVEGIDGSGKSTQLSLLYKWLESKGYGVVFTSGILRRW